MNWSLRKEMFGDMVVNSNKAEDPGRKRDWTVRIDDSRSGYGRKSR
jgi:hypothetical protein